MPAAKIKEEPNDEAPPAKETAPPAKPNDKTLPPHRANKAKSNASAPTKIKKEHDRPVRRAPYRNARGSDHRDEAPDEWASDADTNRYSDDDDSGSEYAPDGSVSDEDREGEEDGDEHAEGEEEESPTTGRKRRRTKSASKAQKQQPARKSRRTARNGATKSEERDDIEWKDDNEARVKWEGPSADQYEYTAPAPERDEETGRLTFEGFPDFNPNLTPEEVIQMGSFGGTYYRPIHSSIMNEDIADDWKIDLPEEWVKGIDVERMLTSGTYHTDVNRFKAKCGLTLEEWEQNGWITGWDPRGWFQWYVRFYRGRRCDDDKRQVSRWKKCAHERSGRWLRVYLGKYLKAGLDEIPSDPKQEKISPVIRQVLQHWGIAVNNDVYGRFKEEKGAK
ncbi:hypothetical protein HDV00_001525 [Rhizophlyctis rosea]|nr:hypothetical protein HDV00_001525 [Rhizophlyctis rosea]